MTGLDTGLPPAWQTAGGLIGFVLSLMIFSYVVRENRLARAAQYLLVGVGLGYLALLTWDAVLWPRLFDPASPTLAAPLSLPMAGGQGELGDALLMRWIPLLLGLFLWVSGLDALGKGARPGRWTRLLAVLPLALLVGVGLGVGVAGAVQGALLPQLQRGVQLGRLVAASNELLIIGGLTLAVTGGALIRLHILDDPERPLPLPGPFLALLQGWGWVGQRALWLAAGVIFARLFASRMTLLIARLDQLLLEPALRDVWLRFLQALGQGGF